MLSSNYWERVGAARAGEGRATLSHYQVLESQRLPRTLAALEGRTVNRADVLHSLAVVVVLLLGTAAVAADQPAEARMVTFLTPVQIEGTPLPPDTYMVKHVIEGQEHALVFVSAGSKKRHEHRVKCQVKSLAKKSAFTEQRFAEDSSGKRTIISLVFEGDDVEYVF